MSRIDIISIEYDERFPIAAVRYTFEAEILDLEVLGHHLRHLAKTVEHHLTDNNIYDYQLGLNMSLDIFKNFNACLSRQQNYELMHHRIELYAQSRLGLLGDNNKLTVVITALLLYPTLEH